MNALVTYKVDEELVCLLVRQTFFRLGLKRRWVVPAALLTYGGFLLVYARMQNEDLNMIGVILVALAVGLFLGLLKSYLDTLSESEEYFTATFKGEEVSFEVSPLEISISSDSASERIEISAITHVVETRDFLVLMVGKFPWFAAPKSELGDDLSAWLRALHSTDG